MPSAILAACVITAGCGKRDSNPEVPASPTSPPAALPPASQPPPALRTPAAAVPAQPVIVPGSANVEAVLEQLTLELRKYVMRTRTVPRSFEEFVTRAQVQVPPPPAGKKYAIQDQAVVLVPR